MGSENSDPFHSGNSGTVGTGKQVVLKFEMTRSSRGSIEVNETPSLEDPIEDRCRQILVV